MGVVLAALQATSIRNTKSANVNLRVIRELAQQKESQLEEGHLMADHVHIMRSVPPKYSVSGVVG